MSRPAMAALGLLGVAVAGAALALLTRRETPALVPAPSGPPPVLAADVSARAGLAPGESSEKPSDVITPLNASHPGQFVIAPDLNEPPLVLEHEGHEPPLPPAEPTVRGRVPRVFQSSGAVIVPLDVRDPSALVMGPGARERDWPTAAPPPRKPPRRPAEPSDVPAAVRGRFEQPSPR